MLQVLRHASCCSSCGNIPWRLPGWAVDREPAALGRLLPVLYYDVVILMCFRRRNSHLDRRLLLAPPRVPE